MKSNSLKPAIRLLAFGALALSAVSAHAARDAQPDPVHASVRSGTMTRDEFHSLMREQHQDRAAERPVQVDTRVDRREDRHLERTQVRAERPIRLQ